MVLENVNVVLSEPSKGNLIVTKGERSIILQYPCDEGTDCTPYEVELPKGKYKFQVIGAAGGITSGEPAEIRGRGGYSEGIYHVTKTIEKLYVYIGGAGGGSTSMKGYNGGGTSYGSASPGGGATDIRTVGGAWDDIDSLESRLIVAGGGGGTRYQYKAGSGGGENGSQGQHLSEDNIPCYGGQEKCEGKKGSKSNEGKLGKGADANQWGENNGAGGGGGGYFGGGSAAKSAGSGGSGYIGKMLSPKSTSVSSNLGNGFAIISLYSTIIYPTCVITKSHIIIPYILILFIK